MAATAPLNKSPHMKQWMTQPDPPNEANTVKKNESPIATHLFKQNDRLL